MDASEDSEGLLTRRSSFLFVVETLLCGGEREVAVSGARYIMDGWEDLEDRGVSLRVVKLEQEFGELARGVWCGESEGKV